MNIMPSIRDIILSSRAKHEKLSLILRHIFVEACGIDQGQYFILGSYALREYRAINDLDINIEASEFAKLARLDFGQIEEYNGQTRWFYDMTSLYNDLTGQDVDDFSIEAFKKGEYEGYPSATYSLGNLRAANGLDCDINGNQFMGLPWLLKWKTEMGRPKDQKDIGLIKHILSTTQKP